MEKPNLTKEYLQRKIDHYSAVSTAHMELVQEKPEKREHHIGMTMFYVGKRDAYADLYNTLYPEMEKERAFPLDEKKQREKIDLMKKI